jgi:hypothetical protein
MKSHFEEFCHLKYNAVLSVYFTLISCSAYSTLKMEEICSSETSVDFQRTTRRYIPEDGTLHNHLCENLSSCIPNVVHLI